MKIICDTCGAKYSIADEKVRGKVFKIRCKKCREIIVVRGITGSEAPAPAPQQEQDATVRYDEAAAQGGEDYGPPLDPAVDPVWHVVLDGEQQGPYTAEQVGQFVAAGQLDHEAYCWRDGFADWMHLGEIDELRGVLPGPSQPAIAGEAPAAGTPSAGVAAAGVGAAGVAAAGYQEPAYGQDAPEDGGGYGGFTAPPSADSAGSAQEAMAGLFGDAPPAAQGGALAGDLATGGPGEVAARGARPDSGADLFAQADEGGLSSPGGANDGMGSSPRVDMGRMTGTRNENSVLFSLSNLQALASDARPGDGGGGAVPSAGPPTTSGEGSGLIDIRAMAAQAGDTQEAAGGVDDLLAIGGGGGFAPTLGAPVLMAQPTERSSKMLYIVLAIGGVLVIGLIIILAVALPGADDPPAVAAQPTVLVQPEPGPSNTTAPPEGTTSQAGVQPTPVAAEDDESEDEGQGSSSRTRSRRRTGRGAGSRASSSSGSDRTAAPAEEPAPAAPAKRRGNDLDSLLDGALGGKSGGSARPKRSGGGDSSLPAKLSRSQVRSGMSSAESSVRRCGNGTSGTVVVNVVINGGTGRVSSATVTGQFAGTPVGSCVARAVRSARFSRFREKTLTVRGYPFRVN